MLKLDSPSRLPLAVLGVFPALILAYAMATATGRFMPSASVTLALCCMAIVLPLIAESQPRFSRSQIVFLMCGMLGVLIPSAVQLWDHASLSVWWKTGERLMALTLAGCLMSARLPLAQMLHVFVASASLAMILAVIPIWWQGGFLRDQHVQNFMFWYKFGLGHPNQLLNTVGLGALGHALWVVVTRLAGIKVPRVSLCLALLGLAATLLLAHEQARRGIAFAGVVGGAGLTVALLWNRQRWLAYALISVLGALAIYGLIQGIATRNSNQASERGLLYLSAWELGFGRWWAGYGHYAMRLTQFTSTDNCASLNALGIWALHAHSEPLEAFIDAGVVGYHGTGLAAGLASSGWARTLDAPVSVRWRDGNSHH